MSRSIMQFRKECYLCRKMLGTDADLPDRYLEEHHVVFGTANRKKSEQYGLKVYLCHFHHTGGVYASVHRNKKIADELCEEAQRCFERSHSRKEWMREFGKNYL